MERIHYLITDNGLIHSAGHLSRNCNLSGRRLEYPSMTDVVDVAKHAKLTGCSHCLDEGEVSQLRR